MRKSTTREIGLRFTFYVLGIALPLCVLLDFTALSTESAFLDRAGIRPLGMGGAFVAQADDSSAGLWNPAGLAQLKQAEIVASYSALHTGLGDDTPGRSYLAYALPVHPSGTVGINIIRLQSPLYSETTAIFSYSQRFHFLYLGGNAKGLFANFSENEYTEIDPLFQKYGRLSKNVSFDLGLLIKMTDVLALGIAVQNLNEPNLALEEGQQSLLPRELKAGLSVKLARVHTNLDFTWRDTKVRDKQDINLHLGVEAWLTHDIGLRTGVNFYDLTAGASSRFDKPGRAFQLNYAFNYPMPFEIADEIVPAPLTGTSGSHQFSVSVGFSSLRQLFSPPQSLETPESETSKFFESSDLDTSNTEKIGASLSVDQQAVRDDETNPEAHFRLAQTYAKLHQYDEAIQHLKQAAKLIPQNPKYHYALAAVYQRYGETTGRKTWYY